MNYFISKHDSTRNTDAEASQLVLSLETILAHEYIIHIVCFIFVKPVQHK